MNNASCFPPTNNEPPDDLRQTVYAVISPVILAFGLLLNTFSLFAAAKSALNSVALSYLLSLILSNVALMILAVPWLIHRSSDQAECHTHSNAFYHAYIEPPLLNWMTTFSTYVLVCMSFERYVSITHPGFFRRIHILSKAQIVLVSSLLLALVIHIPMFLKQMMTCSDCWTTVLNIQVTSTTSWLAYTWIVQMLSRFLPCAALVFLNISAIVKYRRIINKRSKMTTNAVSNSQLNTPSSSLTNLNNVKIPKKPPSQSSQDEKRQLRLLSGLVCLVALCIIPAGVAALLPSQYSTFRVVVEALELFHHAVVSFVICLCNNDIHRRLRKMITCTSAALSVWSIQNDGKFLYKWYNADVCLFQDFFILHLHLLLRVVVWVWHEI